MPKKNKAEQKSNSLQPGNNAGNEFQKINSKKDFAQNIPASPFKYGLSQMHIHAPVIQAKLTINQPNDVYEQEADAVADKVVSTSLNSEINPVTLLATSVQQKHKTSAKVISSVTDKPENPPLSFQANPLLSSIENSKSGGSSLPLGIKGNMESAFETDFSKVRIHTDNRASELNKGLNARAFTYGSNIYFNNGQFEPGSKEGKKLLAHELTHVVQQGNKPASSGNTIQRSLLGGILGGLGGALGGAVLGGVIGGPIGAVIGGIAGLIGGALIGDSVSTKSRALTSAEITYAKEIFRDSIDYSEIKITRDGMLSAGAPRTIGNTINLKSDWGHFVGDTMELTQVGKETLIHEMGHVWQYQNGGLAYIPESLIAQLKVSISGQSRNAAYDWRAADAAKIPWEEWNPEQQAESIEDYNKLLRKSKDGTATVTELADLSALLKYMQKVWNREGAPTFKTGDPANAPF